MSGERRELATLTVRRWGENEATPVVIDHRDACGGVADHYRRGCIGLRLEGRGMTRLVHLTTDEALRLADLLRAMASADVEARSE